MHGQHLNSQVSHAQVVLVDGCGVLHPRGIGSASQLGVVTGIPTVGVAKALLHVDGLRRSTIQAAMDAAAAASTTGLATEDREPGQMQLMSEMGDVLGVALRAGAGKNPVYVSVGHCVSLDTAVELVQTCCRYRVPEPVRQADIRSRAQARLWETERLTS